MGYTSWSQKHQQKHKAIVNKLLLKSYSKEQIIDYFDFENMKKYEVDFCPLYKKNKKCHDMKELNCYLCACPNFRYNDNGIKKLDDKIVYSLCGIDSKDARQGIYGAKIHQDCSNCTIPHTKEYVRKHFNLDWSSVMDKCSQEDKI